MKPAALHISVSIASWIPQQGRTHSGILRGRAVRRNGRTHDSLQKMRRVRATELPSPMDWYIPTV